MAQFDQHCPSSPIKSVLLQREALLSRSSTRPRGKSVICRCNVSNALIYGSYDTSTHCRFRNTFYKLNVENVNDTNSSGGKFYELEMKPGTDALAQCSARTRDQELKCQNHVRTILRKGDGNLFVCSTNALSPIVSTLDGTSMEILKTGMSGAAICPSDPDDNGTAVWVEHGNPGNIPSVYSATVTDYTGAYRVIYRPPLRKDQEDMQWPYMSTIQADSKWLKEPNFIASFDVGDGYVYFFFRELGVEYASCDAAVYSRVARICKSDVGGRNLLKQTWTSFLKTRINCSLSGDFPFYFNEIREHYSLAFLSKLPLRGTILEDVYMVKNSNHETFFYATFTTSLNGFSGSAICIYSLADIKHVFDHSNFKGQASPAHAWQSLSAKETPTVRPGQCVRDSKLLSDADLHFVKTHALMEKSIAPVTSKAGNHFGPIFYKKDVILTKLAVDLPVVDGKMFPVIYAGTNNGAIYTIATWTDSATYQNGNLLSVQQLPSREPVQAIELLQEKYLYICQDIGVSQLAIAQCDMLRSCTSCAQSPYCAWDSIRQLCYRARHADRNGSIKFSSSNPAEPACVQSVRRITKLLYPGDSISMNCYQRRESGDQSKAGPVWLFNNRSVDFQDGRHFLSVDNSLIIINVSSPYTFIQRCCTVLFQATKECAGSYECVQHRTKLVSYNLLIDDGQHFFALIYCNLKMLPVFLSELQQAAESSSFPFRIPGMVQRISRIQANHAEMEKVVRPECTSKLGVPFLVDLNRMRTLFQLQCSDNFDRRKLSAAQENEYKSNRLVEVKG
ncbi:hypothetical protein M513_00395 [Trichuris suis]|uniref:Semaphorin-2A n=1 Tax=Trichuris suis TaxID=68888 RepID=A0A085MNA6_9BILA|nr:hypothetical protein M513_00395 [Trichuris suis]